MFRGMEETVFGMWSAHGEGINNFYTYDETPSIIISTFDESIDILLT
jgi:hypothetical protein